MLSLDDVNNRESIRIDNDDAAIRQKEEAVPFVLRTILKTRGGSPSRWTLFGIFVPTATVKSTSSQARHGPPSQRSGPKAKDRHAKRICLGRRNFIRKYVQDCRRASFIDRSRKKAQAPWSFRRPAHQRYRLSASLTADLLFYFLPRVRLTVCHPASCLARSRGLQSRRRSPSPSPDYHSRPHSLPTGRFCPPCFRDAQAFQFWFCGYRGLHAGKLIVS